MRRAAWTQMDVQQNAILTCAYIPMTRNESLNQDRTKFALMGSKTPMNRVAQRVGLAATACATMSQSWCDDTLYVSSKYRTMYILKIHFELHRAECCLELHMAKANPIYSQCSSACL